VVSGLRVVVVGTTARAQEWREKEREMWSGRRRWMSAQAEGEGTARRRELAEAREERWPEVRRTAWAPRKLAGAAVATAAIQEEGPALRMPLSMVSARAVAATGATERRRTRAPSAGWRGDREGLFSLVEKRSVG